MSALYTREKTLFFMQKTLLGSAALLLSWAGSALADSSYQPYYEFDRNKIQYSSIKPPVAEDTHLVSNQVASAPPSNQVAAAPPPSSNTIFPTDEPRKMLQFSSSVSPVPSKSYDYHQPVAQDAESVDLGAGLGW